ncbi:MAG TPA: hypothetical protein VIV11_37010 [Kofleriaceae bacterium]
MTREEFARRLHEAALRSIAFARELIVNQVPDEYRFDIVIKPHGPEHVGPIVDPHLMDLWKRGGEARELTVDQAVAELWHDGRVPEWIDISLDAIELPRDDPWRVVSFVQLRCSRDLVDDKGLWYANEGVPPFHFHSPALPHDWSKRHTDAEGRFDPKGNKFILPSRKKR